MLEINLINVNFVLLFGTMSFYWLKSLSFLSKQLTFLPHLGSQVSIFVQILFLCLRWYSSGHFPLSNLYESLIFLSCSLTGLLIYLTETQKNRFFSPLFLPTLLLNQEEKGDEESIQKLVQKRTVKSEIKLITSSFIGSIMMPIILLINTFAVFSLPMDLKKASALVPALQSNWLVMHVTVMLLSYGALFSGCLFAMAYLIIPLIGINKQDTIDLSETFDNLSYRILGLGFPLLTIGLLSGAVWANQTWGSYWSWDPKETWALITWFIFAIYFHTRLSKGWSGRKSAFLAVFGFIILWVCYLGVNLMGKGLHSYGFLN
jgi:cytochrome c-type biogenesis protein CcsB